MGNPLAEARGEVTFGAEFLRWFSEGTVRDYGRYLTTPEGKNKILVQHKPIGPCLLITPWNFPLAMATRKVERRRRWLVDGPGYFYQPTILGNVPIDAAALGQEIFGPVAPVTTFATE